MPQVPIIMPQLGESIAEATIVDIKVKPGDEVATDQEIIDVETNKAVMGVTTPCPGEIAKIDAEVKGTYSVGAVLGYVEASEADAARFQKRAPRFILANFAVFLRPTSFAKFVATIRDRAICSVWSSNRPIFFRWKKRALFEGGITHSVAGSRRSITSRQKICESKSCSIESNGKNSRKSFSHSRPTSKAKRLRTIWSSY